MKTDFTNIICDKCGRDSLNSKNALREYKNGMKTGKWLCHSCYMKHDYNKRPDCGNNTHLRNHTTINQNPTGNRNLNHFGSSTL